MAWSSPRFWKLCALDLAALAALAAIALARVPPERTCMQPQLEAAAPGFASLSEAAAPACLRFNLR